MVAHVLICFHFLVRCWECVLYYYNAFYIYQAHLFIEIGVLLFSYIFDFSLRAPYMLCTGTQRCIQFGAVVFF